VNEARFVGRGLLDPVDRVSEVMFGLLMAVSIVGALSIANAGRQDVRTALIAALGCNLAWGLVDAVMYLVRTLTERTRNASLARQVTGASLDHGHRAIVASLPDHVAAIVGEAEVEAMRQRLLALKDAPRGGLHGEDYLAALGIFLLVVLATFPIVIPFLVTDDATRAMQASRLITVVMLFVAGFALGRYAGHARPALTGFFMALLGAALIAAIKALGG
jgi:VIT1/CCC1 family predicted Fe2+/Mn2+ transporter